MNESSGTQMPTTAAAVTGRFIREGRWLEDHEIDEAATLHLELGQGERESFETLRAALPQAFRHRFAPEGPPELRIRAGLRRLSEQGPLADGSVPLILWLREAAVLAGARPEGPQLHALRALVEARRDAAPLDQWAVDRPEPVVTTTTPTPEPGGARRWRKAWPAVRGSLVFGPATCVLGLGVMWAIASGLDVPRKAYDAFAGEPTLPPVEAPGSYSPSLGTVDFASTLAAALAHAEVIAVLVAAVVVAYLTHGRRAGAGSRRPWLVLGFAGASVVAGLVALPSVAAPRSIVGLLQGPLQPSVLARDGAGVPWSSRQAQALYVELYDDGTEGFSSQQADEPDRQKWPCPLDSMSTVLDTRCQSALSLLLLSLGGLMIALGLRPPPEPSAGEPRAHRIEHVRLPQLVLAAAIAVNGLGWWLGFGAFGALHGAASVLDERSAAWEQLDWKDESVVNVQMKGGFPFCSMRMRETLRVDDSITVGNFFLLSERFRVVLQFTKATPSVARVHGVPPGAPIDAVDFESCEPGEGMIAANCSFLVTTPSLEALDSGHADNEVTLGLSADDLLGVLVAERALPEDVCLKRIFVANRNSTADAKITPIKRIEASE